jgi:hypothetical protein
MKSATTSRGYGASGKHNAGHWRRVRRYARHELESRLFYNLYCCFGLLSGLCWLRFLFRYSSAETVSSEASGLRSSAQS